MKPIFNAIALLALWTIAVAPSTSLACTCRGDSGKSEDQLLEAFCQVDAVFVGIAEESDSRPDGVEEITIRLVEKVKGDLPANLIAKFATNCDQWFKVDAKYIVFAMLDKGSNRLEMSVCGPTRFTSRFYASDPDLLYDTVQQASRTIDKTCGKAESSQRRARIWESNRSLYGEEYDRLIDESKMAIEPDR